MQQSLGDKIFVKFKSANEFEYKTLKLIKSDIYYRDSESTDDAMEGKVNKLLVNPQVATVMVNNQKHRVAKGDTVFLHYLAYEWGQDETIEIDGEELNVIGGGFILFKIVDGKIQLIDDLFLGKTKMMEKLTLSGLHININEKREPCIVTLTHIPTVRNGNVRHLKVGDTIKSVDDHQYIINYNNEDFVVLKSQEIVATIEN